MVVDLPTDNTQLLSDVCTLRRYCVHLGAYTRFPVHCHIRSPLPRYCLTWLDLLMGGDPEI